MKTKFIALVLGALLTMPCVLHAEEVEIQLMEVVSMGFMPGDNPLDGPDLSDPNPTRPNDFHASLINGHGLSINKLNTNIPSARARVVKATTGSTVLDQQFTSSLSEQIADNGVYVLRIETDGGALVGQFIVQ